MPHSELVWHHNNAECNIKGIRVTLILILTLTLQKFNIHWWNEDYNNQIQIWTVCNINHWYIIIEYKNNL